MLTGQPISTVTYNSEEFIKTRSDELVTNHMLEYYFFIRHKGEPTACNDLLKDHIHWYGQPSKRIDTLELREYFKENDPTHPDKPLGAMEIVKSKFPDWYLYGIHDLDYLAMKNLIRYYTYSQDDVVASDYDILEYKVKEINIKTINIHKEIYEYQKKGFTFYRYAMRKNIHPMQMKGYQEVWNSVFYFTLEEQKEKEKALTQLDKYDYKRYIRNEKASVQEHLPNQNNIIIFKQKNN